MSLIDHDLDHENVKDPLDLTPAPFEGHEVKHHCPICLTVRLREFPQEQGGVDEGISTVGYQWECPKCKRATAYMRSVERAAAAVKGWVNEKG
jgi:hypothetical protein